MTQHKLNNQMTAIDELFNTFLMRPAFHQSKFVRIPTNIIEKEDHFELEMMVPGIKEEEISVEVKDQKLNVGIEIKTESESKTFIRKDFAVSNNFKTFDLPDGTVADDVTAQLMNGILKISIKKIGKQESKSVKINLS